MQLKQLLDKKYLQFNTLEFIEDDPISIPHRFSKLQDIEITGFWIAMLSWGQRKTIINKGNELIDLMDGQPYDFILNHSKKDLKSFENFKHRTFNFIDTKYFIRFLSHFYTTNDSLETLFLPHKKGVTPMKHAFINFHNIFFSLNDFPSRTKKHIATPERNSTCKRLNMFLRWMVRKDASGVDFGIWKNIKTADLLCPLDVHVGRVARHLGLIERKQNDWQTVIELTNNLKKLDTKDPVKYDFALFGMGIHEKISFS